MEIQIMKVKKEHFW